MSEYIPPDYKTVLTNPVKALEISKERPEPVGNAAKKALSGLGHFLSDRGEAVHTATVDVCKAGIYSARAIKDWTLFATRAVPFAHVDKNHTAERAMGSTGKIAKYALSALISPIIGLINPFWVVGLHERLGLYSSLPKHKADEGFQKNYDRLDALRPKLDEDLMGKLPKDNFRKRAIERVMNQYLDRGDVADAEALKPNVTVQYRLMEKADKLKELKKSPQKLIDEMLKEDGSEMAEAIYEELQACLTPAHLSNYSLQPEEEVKNFRALVCAACNRQELKRLYEEIKNKYGQGRADFFVSDWNLIGTDIRDNKALLAKDRKLEILASAENLEEICKRHGVEFKKFMGWHEQVQGRVKKGDLPLKNIKTDYNLYHDIIGELGPKYSFRRDLNELFRVQLITQKTKNAKFRIDSVEKKVYEMLGWNVKDLIERRGKVQARIVELIDELFQDSETESLDWLKDEANKLSFKAKLDVMGHANHADRVWEMMEYIKTELGKQSGDMAAEVNKKIDEQINNEALKNYPLYQDYLKRRLHRSGKKYSSKLLQEAANQVKKDLPEKPGPEVVQKKIEELVPNIKDSLNYLVTDDIESRGKIVEKWIEIFRRWPGSIKQPMIQGYEDAQEVLTEGVCWALCNRLMKKEKDHPEMKASELKDDVKICAKDRFAQARYQVDKEGRARDVPIYSITKTFEKFETLKTSGTFEKFETFAADAEKVLNEADNKEKLEKDNYIVRVSLGRVSLGNDGWSHALYFRADPERRIYHFFDPNIGLSVDFPLNPDSPEFDGPKQEMLTCLQDFLDKHYIRDKPNFFLFEAAST